MSNSPTKSEIAFEEFCTSHGYKCNQIPKPSNGRFADFEVVIHGTKIVCEVSELRPNEQDETFVTALETSGFAGMYEEVGRRLRNKIKTEKDQLKVYRNRKLPCLLVFYDNLYFRKTHGGNYLSDDDFQSAMYGLPKSKTPFDGEFIGHAGKRLFGQATCEYISALGVLRDEGEFRMTLYHNFFATIPLPMSLFECSTDRQCFKKDDPSTGPWGWEICTGTRCGPGYAQ